MIGKCNTVGGKPEEEKTVTAGTSVIEVNPSSGKVMKKVTVNPTPSETKTVTPTAAGLTVTPDAGKLLNKVIVNGDSDLVAGNIKKGVDIFGVTGTLKGAAPNGTKWTQIVARDGLICAGAIAYGDGLWVWGQGQCGLLYSTDCINWTESNIDSTSKRHFTSIRYEEGIWVACEYAYTSSNVPAIWYSLDGKIWTQTNITGNTVDDALDIRYHKGIWYASFDGGSGYYSTDGKTWTYLSCALVDYGNGKWLGLSTYLQSSTDGISWTTVSSSGMTFGFHDKNLIYGNGVWVCCPGEKNCGLWYSTDGNTFTQSNITNGNYNVGCVVYKNGLWVALASSNTSKGIIYSADGKIWSEATGDPTYGCYAIDYSDGMWIAFAGGAIYYSTNGKTWARESNNLVVSVTFINSTRYLLTHSNGKWIISGDEGLYASPTWES